MTTSIAGMASGRVRAMINDRGERVESAGPSVPVEVMGFDDVPAAGDEHDRRGRRQAEPSGGGRAPSEAEGVPRGLCGEDVAWTNLFASIEEGKQVTLNLIIKADVQGSVEAVKQALEKLSNDEVKVRVLHSGAGAITKDDVNAGHARSTRSSLALTFAPTRPLVRLRRSEKVDVRLYTRHLQRH